MTVPTDGKIAAHISDHPHVPKRKQLLAQSLAQPPITRVCRVIREETLPTFYSTNKLIIWCTNSVDYDALKILVGWARMLKATGYRTPVRECVFATEWMWDSDLETVLEELFRWEVPTMTLYRRQNKSI